MSNNQLHILFRDIKHARNALNAGFIKLFTIFDIINQKVKFCYSRSFETLFNFVF